MAVHKVKRSNPLAQPQPKSSRRRSNNPQIHPQNKTHLFDVLHHLNRGYGIALINLDLLERNQNRTSRLFPRNCLRNLRSRTEELRALANHELLRIMTGREQQDAQRFGQLRTRGEKASQAKAHKI
jgi:hypothetical protein